MLVFTVDAKYAPEVEAAVLLAVRMIQTDELLRSSGGPDFIKPPRIDESRKGSVTIAIGEDAEMVVLAAFPQRAQEQLLIDNVADTFAAA